MKLEKLSSSAQEGLRRFYRDVHGDELYADSIASVPMEWAWLYFQLRAAPDCVEWFPKGKWATIQFIEGELLREAKEQIGSCPPIQDKTALSPLGY